LSKISRDLVINTKQNLFNARKKISSKAYEIGTLLNERLNNTESRLDEKKNYLKYRLKYFFQNKQQEILQVKKSIDRIAGYKLNKEAEKLQSMEKINELSNPEKVLSRGFSITLHEGKALKDAKKVQSGDELITVLHKGKIKTKVK